MTLLGIKKAPCFNGPEYRTNTGGLTSINMILYHKRDVKIVTDINIEIKGVQ